MSKLYLMTTIINRNVGKKYSNLYKDEGLQVMFINVLVVGVCHGVCGCARDALEGGVGDGAVEYSAVGERLERGADGVLYAAVQCVLDVFGIGGGEVALGEVCDALLCLCDRCLCLLVHFVEVCPDGAVGAEEEFGGFVVEGECVGGDGFGVGGGLLHEAFFFGGGGVAVNGGVTFFTHVVQSFL